MFNTANKPSAAVCVPAQVTQMKVAMVDPANFVPYYSESLVRNLPDTTVTLFTCQFQHTARKAQCPTEYVYFPIEHFFSFQNKRVRALSRLLQLPFCHLYLLSILALRSYNIVHLQWSRVPFIDLLFLKAAKLLGLQVVYTVHDIEPLYRFSGSTWVHRQLLQSADQIVVLSSWAEGKLKKRYGLENARNISVIPHGPMQSGSTLDCIHARKVLGLAEEKFAVLLFGSLKGFKGIDLFLATADECQIRGRKDIVFLIVGNPESENIKATIEIAKLKSKNINTVLKYVPDSDEALYFSAVDVVALPYQKISQSGVMATAIAYHKPLLTTDVGNFREIIETYENGKILPQNCQPWADEIIRLAETPETIRRMSKNSSKAVHGELSWKKIGLATEKIYKNGCK